MKVRECQNFDNDIFLEFYNFCFPFRLKKMAFHVPRTGMQTMMKKGTRYLEGKEEVVYDSISTIKELGDTVKEMLKKISSLKINFK